LTLWIEITFIVSIHLDLSIEPLPRPSFAPFAAKPREPMTSLNKMLSILDLFEEKANVHSAQ
jgi:hypothetical protein